MISDEEDVGNNEKEEIMTERTSRVDMDHRIMEDSSEVRVDTVAMESIGFDLRPDLESKGVEGALEFDGCCIVALSIVLSFWRSSWPMIIE